jgi:hypothetical protein
MARGWESKSVESQMEAAEERNARRNAVELTPEKAAKLREREGLLLSRQRVLADIAAASNPNYRRLLESSLAFLDQKLAALDVSTPDRRE